MPETFNCPNCGAPLNYQGSDPIIRCPYCNGSVVVPENLRGKPSFSSQPHNFTLNGITDMGGLISQARRFKEVKDLAQAGNLDEAIRIYSEITGQGPELASSSVEALAHGRPITLSGLNVGGFLPTSSYTDLSSVQVSTSPPMNIKPVDNKTSGRLGRIIGCSVGCFVVALVSFILLTTLVPVLGGLAGVAVGLKPGLVLTALPNIQGLVGSGFGKKELSFGGEGTGAGLFDDVRAISVNSSSGEIFAADYSGGRVQKFDPQGKFITQWIVEGKNITISNMVADRKGNVYILATGSLLEYSTDGKLVGKITAGDTSRFDDITMAADGSLVGIQDDTIIHFNSNGEILNQIPSAIAGANGDADSDTKIAVDGRGNIFLLGAFTKSVFKFAPNGRFINRFGADGDQPGEFSAPGAIAVDGKGQVYVSDSKGVQVFSNDGRYINVISVEYYAYGLAFDDQGKLYVTTNQKKVEKFSVSQ